MLKDFVLMVFEFDFVSLGDGFGGNNYFFGLIVESYDGDVWFNSVLN